MIKTKATQLKNGNRINYDQLLIAAPNIARDGAKKRTHVPEVAFGMVHQGADRNLLSDFHHGIPLSDLPNVPFKSCEQQAPIHSGMTDDQHAYASTVKDVLGRPVGMKK
jgi:hypothetical protein